VVRRGDAIIEGSLPATRNYALSFGSEIFCAALFCAALKEKYGTTKTNQESPQKLRLSDLSLKMSNTIGYINTKIQSIRRIFLYFQEGTQPFNIHILLGGHPRQTGNTIIEVLADWIAI